MTICSILKNVSPDLIDAEYYWRSLRRAKSAMPFANDVDLKKLGKAAESVALLDVLEVPARFRISTAGRTFTENDARVSVGLFLDEIDDASPWREVVDQCRETLETFQPTYRVSGIGQRFVAPLWNGGRIGSLLVALSRPHLSLIWEGGNPRVAARRAPPCARRSNRYPDAADSFSRTPPN